MLLARWLQSHSVVSRVSACLPCRRAHAPAFARCMVPLFRNLHLFFSYFGLSNHRRSTYSIILTISKGKPGKFCRSLGNAHSITYFILVLPPPDGSVVCARPRQKSESTKSNLEPHTKKWQAKALCWTNEPQLSSVRCQTKSSPSVKLFWKTNFAYFDLHFFSSTEFKRDFFVIMGGKSKGKAIKRIHDEDNKENLPPTGKRGRLEPSEAIEKPALVAIPVSESKSPVVIWNFYFPNSRISTKESNLSMSFFLQSNA